MVLVFPLRSLRLCGEITSFTIFKFTMPNAGDTILNFSDFYFFF